MKRKSRKKKEKAVESESAVRPQPEYCERCRSKLDESCSVVTIYKGQDFKDREYICYRCSQIEAVEEYRRNGEISTSLMIDASMCAYHVKEGRMFEGLRTEVKHHYELHYHTLCKIAEEVEEIHAKGREFEEKHWLPRIRKYWNDSSARGHSFVTEDWKALMWGSAGRVLITIQDTKLKGKYGGAYVSLIFDDSADYARGGIQGICATREEGLGLVQAAIDGLGDFKEDNEVTLAGL